MSFDNSEFEEEISAEQGDICYAPTNTTISGSDLIDKIQNFAVKHNITADKVEVEFTINGTCDHEYGIAVLRIMSNE